MRGLGIGLGLTRRATSETIGPDTSVSTAWAGDVTDTAFTAVHTTAADTSGARLVVSTDNTFATGNLYSARGNTSTKTVRHTITGLTADTTYYFAIEINGTIKTTKSGSFKTMAQAPGTAHNFRFAFGGCQSGANNGKILDQIRGLATKPRFFIHTGDLFYDDIATDSEALFDTAYDAVLGGTYSGPLLRNIPTYSIHDDHDYGPNNSGASSASRTSSLAAFRRRRPNPALASSTAGDPVYYSFIQGRIRFIVTDQRSMLDSTTCLGATQLSWFQAQLAAAYSANQVVCFVSSTPFLSTSWGDGWDTSLATRTERTTLGAAIVAAGMGSRIFCIQGDRHYVGGDSGAHTDWALYGGLKMPVFVAQGISGAATLPPNYLIHDIGATFPKTSNAGYIDVTDNGTTITLDFTAIGMDAAEGAATTIYTHSTSLPRSLSGPTSIGLVQESYWRRLNTSGTGAGPTSYTAAPFKTTPVAGNLLILSINMFGNVAGEFTAPTGWTRYGTDRQSTDNTFEQAIFWRVATGTETDITYTFSGQRTHAGALFEFSGANTTTPIGQEAADLSNTVNRTSVAAAVTSANDDDFAIAFALYGGQVESGATWGDSFVERYFSPEDPDRGSMMFFVGTKQMGVSGSTATPTCSWSDATPTKAQQRTITIRKA